MIPSRHPSGPSAGLTQSASEFQILAPPPIGQCATAPPPPRPPRTTDESSRYRRKRTRKMTNWTRKRLETQDPGLDARTAQWTNARWHSNLLRQSTPSRLFAQPIRAQYRRAVAQLPTSLRSTIARSLTEMGTVSHDSLDDGLSYAQDLQGQDLDEADEGNYGIKHHVQQHMPEHGGTAREDRINDTLRMKTQRASSISPSWHSPTPI